VQIHPGSLLTPDGMRIIHNFISLSGVLRLAG
jgi:anthranilate/para-aminobenzoate synthase component II